MTMTHREAVHIEQHTRDMYQRGEQLLLHIQSIQRGIAGMSRRVFTLGFFFPVICHALGFNHCQILHCLEKAVERTRENTN